VAQTEWTGVWIGRHGRAKTETDVPAAPEVMSDYKILSGTQG